MPIRPPTHKLTQAVTKRHEAPEQQRGTSASRGYGYKWQQARAGYLALHPLCAECERNGRIEVAKELDHIVPHKGDMALFWNFKTNVQGLCKACHSRKTAAEDGGWGNPQK